MSSERRVRQLRLRTPSDAALRQALPRIEDALRCASLPGAGARLLLVRRLALGRIDAQASTQRLALQVERCVAAARWCWVDGADVAAAAAPAVCFDSALHARVALSLRLLCGQPVQAWHWPLAVPEFSVEQPAVHNVQRIATVLAQQTDAAAALPAWAGALVDAGAAAALGAALPDMLARRLLHMATGRTAPAHADGAVAALPATPAPSAVLAAAGAHHAHPPWLQALLAAAPGAWPTAAPSGSTDRPQARTRDRAPTDRQAPPAQAARMWSDRALHAPRSRGSAPRPDAPKQDTTTGGPPDAPAPRLAMAHPARADPAGLRDPGSRPDASGGPPDTMPQEPSAARPDSGQPLAHSAAAGLFFLLPVLARVGIDDWLDGVAPRPGLSDTCTHFHQRVLLAALQRLQVVATDPVHRAFGPAQPAAAALSAPLPAAWTAAGALHVTAPPAASRLDLCAALSTARQADAQALVWLHAARRWLRRVAGIGLASLVLRPGAVAATPTHIDLHFALQDADLRLRRLGLDIDPGWHPGLRRVLAYHYGRSPGLAR